MTACARAARTAGRRLRFDLGAINNAVSRAAARGLLLQDVHVAALVLAPRLRAGDPRRRRPRRAPVAAGSRSLSAPLRTLRRAGDRRRARRAGGGACRRASGARVILCDEQAELGGSLLAEARANIDGRPARPGCGETLDTLGRHADVTLLPRTTAFGYFPDNLVGLVERVTDHLRRSRPRLPRERLWQVRAEGGRASPPARSSGRWFPRQRPARHHAGRCGSPVSAALRRARPGTRA